MKNLPSDALGWLNAYAKGQKEEMMKRAEVERKIGKDIAQAGSDAWDWTKKTVQHDIPDAAGAFTVGLDQAKNTLAVAQTGQGSKRKP